MFIHEKYCVSNLLRNFMESHRKLFVFVTDSSLCSDWVIEDGRDREVPEFHSPLNEEPQEPHLMKSKCGRAWQGGSELHSAV